MFISSLPALKLQAFWFRTKCRYTGSCYMVKRNPIETNRPNSDFYIIKRDPRQIDPTHQTRLATAPRK